MATDPRPGGRAHADHTTWWTVTAAATIAWGAVAADRALAWQSVMALLLAAGMVGATLSLSAEAVSSDTIDLVRAARAGLRAGVVVLVGVGLAVSLGAAGVAFLALLLLTRPRLRADAGAAWARLRRREEQRSEGDEAARSGRPGGGRDDAWDRTVAGSLATDPTPASVPTPSASVPIADAPLDAAPDWSPTLAVPTHLSDHDLCLAWESGGRALHRCATVGERLEVVRVRQACLDELERRRPDAVRAWFLAGADPDTSPARYLGR